MAFDARQAFDREEIDLYWQLARQVVPTLHRLKGSTRPLPFVEDLAVPPAALLDFLVRMQNTLKRHQVTASLFGHVGHGQLHVRPFLDLTNAEDVRKMEDLAADLYREVFEVGGTISGEHGDGLSRTPFIRQQFGELYDVFREVKRIFDPLGILNPGKIVGDEGRSLTRDLRPQCGCWRKRAPMRRPAATSVARIDRGAQIRRCPIGRRRMVPHRKPPPHRRRSRRSKCI